MSEQLPYGSYLDPPEEVECAHPECQEIMAPSVVCRYGGAYWYCEHHEEQSRRQDGD